MNDIFAKRLVNARKIRCISRMELCDKLEGKVSLSTLKKYEKAQMMPSSAILILIMRALEFNMDYFFRPFMAPIDFEHFEFRKTPTLSAKKVESLKYLVASEIDKYLEIEDIIGIENNYNLDYSQVKVETELDAKDFALMLRNDLGIGLESVSSVVQLLENQGIKVIEVEVDPKFSRTSTKLNGIPVIVVNKTISPERKRMTIFQELGHQLMRLGVGVDEEGLSTIFASEMLIPSQNLIELIGASRKDISLIEMQSIQRQYGISIDDLLAKAVRLNIISPSRYQSYCKKKKAYPKFKERVEESLVRDECSSRFKRLVYRALTNEMITFSKAAGLLECSVNEVRDNLRLLC